MLFVFTNCKKDIGQIDYTATGFPQSVGKIIKLKCATSGCHNDLSKDAAGGLSLETWDKMFLGTRTGAVVIPYRPDFSTLLYYTNSYDEFGKIHLIPKMPSGSESLSNSEIKILYDWILAGAPNTQGFIKFSDNQKKTKLYAVNKGCDVVTIIDSESGLAIRYIDVGISPINIEAPVMVKVSPDNLYWYVIFYSGTVIQKFRTSDNSYVGSINIGAGIWTSLTISSDSKKAFVSDIQFNGQIVYVDLENMAVLTNYQTGLQDPYDLCIDNANNILYAAPQTGNYIYKINITNTLSPVISEISMETATPVNYSSSLDPYSILLSDDGTKYFVACRTSTELRILQTSNDSLLATIPIGTNASQMILSKTTPYLFLSCEGTGSTKKSAIYIINHQTNSFVSSVYAGPDSRGIALDEKNKKLYVANRNISTDGTAAHHESVCSGKNGYLTIIDLNTLQLFQGYKTEVSVDPYGIGIMH